MILELRKVVGVPHPCEHEITEATGACNHREEQKRVLQQQHTEEVNFLVLPLLLVHNAPRDHEPDPQFFEFSPVGKYAMPAAAIILSDVGVFPTNHTNR